jgi:hypothetical protein
MAIIIMIIIIRCGERSDCRRLSCLWPEAASAPPSGGIAIPFAGDPSLCVGETNLPLATHGSVRHTGATGDVAEWLKAAVC